MKKRKYRELHKKKKNKNKNKEITQNGTENFEKENKKGVIFFEKIFNKKEENGNQETSDVE